MIRPIYKFEITSTLGTTVNVKTVYPVYKNDLSVNWSKESGEMFLRGALSGKLNFIADDFDFISEKSIETEFELRIFISYNAGSSWTQYWTGRFYKTDCEFDEDNKSITVTPSAYDEYNEVLAGLEKEYDLIELAPAITPIKIDKRPMIQIYSPGDSVIACFIAGMYFEQECAEESNETTLTQVGNGKLNFSQIAAERICIASGANLSGANGPYFGTYDTTDYSYNNGTMTFKKVTTPISGGVKVRWSIVRNSDSVELWYYQYSGQNPPVEPPTLTLSPVSGTAASGNVTMDISTKKLFARYILDVDTISGLSTYQLGADDIVSNLRNYTRVIGYSLSDVIYFSSRYSSTPTQYGLYQPGQYYDKPYLYWNPELFPVARSAWGAVSIWFSFSALDWITEQAGRKTYTLKDAFPLSSVISKLLAQIAPDVSHEATTDYSRFLYGASDPLTNAAYTLFITPKSNILAGDYDEPAKKAPITLRSILDMLRDCFRCYWFIDKDDNNNYRFRIEHIKYFLNGGSYSGTPVVGTDLTTMEVLRNGKKWSFDTSKYTFEKSAMPERYQFGWMDDVTSLFNGYPINIISKFVQDGSIEDINITNFTSDVDYMLLNPSACDDNGFALLGATLQSGDYKLPYVNFTFSNSDHYLQNAYMAFYFLQRYYLYDMPAINIDGNFDNNTETANGTKKQKLQDIEFPLFNDPNFIQFIRTSIGDGQIDKISINLLSRMAKATLRYDTE